MTARTFIRRDYYECMNKTSMELNDSTKKPLKTILTRLFIEIETRTKIGTETFSLKNFPQEGQQNLNLIKHSRFAILHIKVYRQLLAEATIRKNSERTNNIPILIKNDFRSRLKRKYFSFTRLNCPRMLLFQTLGFFDYMKVLLKNFESP